MSQDRKIYFGNQMGQELGLGDILHKRDTADRMFVQLRIKNLLSPDCTPEEAMVRAGNLVAYYAEELLHHVDFMAARQADYRLVEFINSYRLKAESTLIAAARDGDYRQIKEIIRSWAEDCKPILDHLLLLVSKIPDEGKKFVLPLPAWMLEKLND